MRHLKLCAVMPVLVASLGLSACGTDNSHPSAGASRNSAIPAATSAPVIDDTVSSGAVDHTVSTTTTSAVIGSDGSICRPLEPPTNPPATNEAVGTVGCICPYDLFSNDDPPDCYPRQLASWKYPGGVGAVGQVVDDIPRNSLGFAPSLPAGLALHAVSTWNFGVSGTYPTLGRLIIGEGANDPLLGGGLRQQIDLLRTLPGTVEERLIDDNPNNDAVVVKSGDTEALIWFPQDGQTPKGQPPIEIVDWIAGSLRYAVTIQLGAKAMLHGPTYDDRIVKFIDSFRPLGES